MPTPLTATEKRFLDRYDETFARPAARGYAVVGALTFVVATGLAWWLRLRKLTTEGTGDHGSVPTFALAAGLLVTAAVLALRWWSRVQMRRLQAQYRGRYVAVGAEGEAPR